MLGGYGFTRDFPVERMMRDASLDTPTPAQDAHPLADARAREATDLGSTVA